MWREGVGCGGEIKQPSNSRLPVLFVYEGFFCRQSYAIVMEYGYLRALLQCAKMRVGPQPYVRLPPSERV